jgi:hypothetical protein
MSLHIRISDFTIHIQLMLWKFALLDCAKATGSPVYGEEGSSGQPAPITWDYPHRDVLVLKLRCFGADLVTYKQEWRCLDYESGP